MNHPKLFRHWLGSAPVIVALACSVGSALAGTPPVTVDWTDPAKFADTTQSMCANRVKPTEWLGDLARYVQRRGSKMIEPGQHLNVTIVDITRAGICEPWRGPAFDDIRIVKEIYPPSIALRYTLTGADGATVRTGEAKLRDPAFLNRGTPNSNDPLRYEKRMFDDWLRREFRR